MKLIAIEEHLLTLQVKAAWDAAPPPADPTAMLDEGVIGERLKDVGDGRLALMDEAGVDVQVLSLTTPGLHNLEPAVSVELACRTNDLIGETVARRPDRFQGFAALPTPAPDACAAELERTVQDLGFKGAMLCGRTRDKHLDHPDFHQMFEAAQRLGVPLFIHPQIAPPKVREAIYSGIDPMTDLALSAFGLGWHYEAGVQFVRLVASGVFDRYPDLQIILGHWGEVVLFYLERLAVFDRLGKLQKPFAAYARDNLYVTASGMFSAAYLQRCVDIVGADRILFSTDFPYQHRPGRQARGFLEAAPLSDENRAKFAHGNWERLTGGA